MSDRRGHYKYQAVFPPDLQVPKYVISKRDKEHRRRYNALCDLQQVLMDWLKRYRKDLTVEEAVEWVEFSLDLMRFNGQAVRKAPDGRRWEVRRIWHSSFWL